MLLRITKRKYNIINGEYNDTFLEDDDMYNNTNRDWDADD